MVERFILIIYSELAKLKCLLCGKKFLKKEYNNHHNFRQYPQYGVFKIPLI
jgi:hypothetical protein